MEEVFRDIPNYEGLYQAGNLGNIKSFRLKNPRLLSQKKRKDGYIQVRLYRDNIGKSFKVHQLIAMTFLKHVPNGHELIVDHIDNDKTNNSVSNLQLITQRENTSKDRYRIKYSSKYLGVTWNKKDNKWQSKIIINNKNKYLGQFVNEYDANLAYQNALKELLKV